MGSTTTTKAPTKARKPRKATFKKVEGGWTPVNKKAKAFAIVLGTDTLTNANLKAIRKAGLLVRQYTAEGKLKAIAL